MDAVELKQRNRRKKRAKRMQKDKETTINSKDSGDEDLVREKPPRPPNRRKKTKEPLCEEDLIDGFSILQFKTYEDLELVLKISTKDNIKRLTDVERPKLEPKAHITHHITVHNNHGLTLSHDPATSDDSGRASERLTGSSVPPRDADSSRDRLSDASSRCSSGKGYICDSEGEDDKHPRYVDPKKLRSKIEVEKRDEEHVVAINLTADRKWRSSLFYDATILDGKAKRTLSVRVERIFCNRKLQSAADRWHLKYILLPIIVRLDSQDHESAGQDGVVEKKEKEGHQETVDTPLTSPSDDLPIQVDWDKVGWQKQTKAWELRLGLKSLAEARSEAWIPRLGFESLTGAWPQT
ncbi:unnamed protein product [Brassicogethes aeneus]|uniref:Uncharacterized protein n=1 Tax=Brassicogethes aeneus TaxID=1431903 RepID=A0A9P0BL37_BRAAE|nr:unnamed protein product [Brassicogethes aeneus]